MLPDVCRRFANLFLRVCLTVVVCNNSIVLVLCLGLENVPSAKLGLLDRTSATCLAWLVRALVLVNPGWRLVEVNFIIALGMCKHPSACRFLLLLLSHLLLS